MKTLKSGALCVLLLAFAWSGAAQKVFTVSEPDYNKPKLFADLPQSFTLDIKALEVVFDFPEGKTVNVPLTEKLRYHGIVVSKSNPADPDVQSIVIRSTNRLGATFTFTRIRNTDGSLAYKGRLLSHKHSDAYELLQENGHYVFHKKHLYDLFNE